MAPIYSTDCIHLASLNGDYTTVDRLVKDSVDIDAWDDMGRTPIQFAASRGHTAIVRCLLDAGADDMHALYYAAKDGHNDTCRLLLERGADPVGIGRIALFSAAAGGHVSTVHLQMPESLGPTVTLRYILPKMRTWSIYLSRQVPRHAQSTLITTEATSDSYHIARKLVAAGVPVGAKNTGGKTAVEIAFSYGNVSIARYIQSNAIGSFASIPVSISG